MESDGELIRAFQRGHAAAFRTLYERYKDRALLYARALAGNDHGAEEALQEAFLAFLRNAASFRECGSFRAYLFASIRSRIIDAARRQSTRRETRDVRSVELFSPAGETNEDLRHEVNRALMALPRDQLEVLVLKIFDGLTFREIAETLRISQNTAASRYRYGCAKLRGRLEGLVTDGWIANGRI